MLIEEVVLKIEAGRGGDGCQYQYGTKPEGGDGGNGGYVYLKGTSKLYDLSTIDERKTYKAENGKIGQKGNKKGANGEDLIISLPLVTEVIIDNVVKYTISESNQTVCLLDGGNGGLGSVSLRKKHSLAGNNIGGESKRIKVKFLLKLQSDVIFLGYPNAGKSSMLNSLTAATAKTAAYQFTTLEPQIGLMDGLKLMDLPGLIEGAHTGKGLGIGFVKHTENSKLLAHFVSLENDEPLETYTSLRDEIKDISEDLYNKPELVILTKTDEFEKDIVKRNEDIFRDKGINVVSCSIIDDESILKVRETIKAQLKSF
ncbi:50S ribosome-binding GTPase [Candidatus Dojkabacteria bacterium]|jgi:GTP-binding protein|nr:50S ribosome-binding GTPase [Candidatus Dojkabacteria bacterium]